MILEFRKTVSMILVSMISPATKMALLGLKYGRVINTPQILIS